MKKRLKMKRYEDGGDVDDDVEPEVIRRSSASGVRVNYEDKAEAKPKRKAASDDDSYDRKEMSRPASASRKEAKEDTSAVTGRMLAKRDTRSAEEKAAENKYLRENIAGPAAVLAATRGVGRYTLGAKKMADRIRDISQTAKAQQMTAKETAMADRIRARQEMFGSGKAAREFAEAGGMKRGGSVGSASRRADGIAMRGKTKGRLI